MCQLEFIDCAATNLPRLLLGLDAHKFPGTSRTTVTYQACSRKTLTQIRDLKASNTLSPSVISCGGHISPGGHSSTSQVTPTSPRPFGSLQRPAGCAGDAAVLSEQGYMGSAVLRASSWSHPAVGRRHRFMQVWARARSLYVDVGKAAVP